MLSVQRIWQTAADFCSDDTRRGRQASAKLKPQLSSSPCCMWSTTFFCRCGSDGQATVPHFHLWLCSCRSPELGPASPCLPALERPTSARPLAFTDVIAPTGCELSSFKLPQTSFHVFISPPNAIPQSRRYYGYSNTLLNYLLGSLQYHLHPHSSYPSSLSPPILLRPKTNHLQPDLCQTSMGMDVGSLLAPSLRHHYYTSAEQHKLS